MYFPPFLYSSYHCPYPTHQGSSNSFRPSQKTPSQEFLNFPKAMDCEVFLRNRQIFQIQTIDSTFSFKKGTRHFVQGRPNRPKRPFLSAIPFPLCPTPASSKHLVVILLNNS
jgi:hypothetical protein